jgi:hypothetical protein
MFKSSDSREAKAAVTKVGNVFMVISFAYLVVDPSLIICPVLPAKDFSGGKSHAAPNSLW